MTMTTTTLYRHPHPTDEMLLKVRRVRVPEAAVLSYLLAQPSCTHDRARAEVMLPDHNLPPGTVVLYCTHGQYSRCYEYVVHHPTFSEVPPGTEIPEWRPIDHPINWTHHLLATHEEILRRDPAYEGDDRTVVNAVTLPKGDWQGTHPHDAPPTATPQSDPPERSEGDDLLDFFKGK